MKKPISRFYLLLVLVPLLLLASMGGYYFLEETAAGRPLHRLLPHRFPSLLRSRPPLPSRSMTLRSWLSGTT